MQIDVVRNLSERQQHVEHLLAVPRLLHVGDLTATAIGNPRLCDFARIDRVIALDVFRPNDAGDDEFADLEVHAYFLLAIDHQIAVRQQLRHDGGHVGLQRFLPIDGAFFVAAGS